MQIDPVDSKNSFRFALSVQTQTFYEQSLLIFLIEKKFLNITNKTFLFEELF